MARPLPQPLFMKDVDLTFDDPDDASDVNYGAHASGVLFTPTASPTTWQGLAPDSVFTDVPAATWTATLTYVQDWDSADSLSRWLYENEGRRLPCTFRPRSGKGPSFTANVVVGAGPIGSGTAGAATATVTMGSDRPALVPAGG